VNAPVTPETLAEVAPNLQPAMLDRAVLDGCLGGAFHPGVEFPWIARVPWIWTDDMRLRSSSKTPNLGPFGAELTPAMATSRSGPLKRIGPGDIIKSYQGKTVEVTDTDAEGRLIMADAIAYSKHYNPAYILDVATLTGWADTVHMDLASVCYSRNKELVEKITKIGDKVGERVWFLPVWDEYTEYIKSNVANVKNYNPNVREGAYYPSMFLLSFVPIELRDKYIHFDVCNNFEKNLARGNCVSLLIETMDALGKK
jgi:hypothetical protein